MNKLKLFLPVLLSCFALSCAGDTKPEPQTAPAPKAQPTPEAKPAPVIEWVDYSKAFKTAEANSDLVMVVFYSKTCGHCDMYAEMSLTDECVVKESKDGFVFTKLDVETKEGQKAYLEWLQPEANENNEYSIAVPTTMIVATIKEVPDFNLLLVKASGVIAPDSLCGAMKKLRAAHRDAVEGILADPDFKKARENSK